MKPNTFGEFVATFGMIPDLMLKLDPNKTYPLEKLYARFCELYEFFSEITIEQFETAIKNNEGYTITQDENGIKTVSKRGDTST